MPNKDHINVGTLNMQGGANTKRSSLADDMQRYIQNGRHIHNPETKISGNRFDTLKSTNRKATFFHYTSGL